MNLSSFLPSLRLLPFCRCPLLQHPTTSALSMERSSTLQGSALTRPWRCSRATRGPCGTPTSARFHAFQQWNEGLR